MGWAGSHQADGCSVQPTGQAEEGGSTGFPLPGFGKGSGKHQPSLGHLLLGCVTLHLGDTQSRVCMPGLSLCDQGLFKALWCLYHPQLYLYIIILYITIYAAWKKSGLLSVRDSCSRTSYSSAAPWGSASPGLSTSQGKASRPLPPTPPQGEKVPKLSP